MKAESVLPKFHTAKEPILMKFQGIIGVQKEIIMLLLHQASQGLHISQIRYHVWPHIFREKHRTKMYFKRTYQEVRKKEEHIQEETLQEYEATITNVSIGGFLARYEMSTTPSHFKSRYIRMRLHPMLSSYTVLPGQSDGIELDTFNQDIGSKWRRRKSFGYEKQISNYVITWSHLSIRMVVRNRDTISIPHYMF